MARLTSLSIRNFRGIRSFDFDFKGESAAILGANGTGKSSVIDALDFLTTGRVRRLTGEGAAGLKLTEHGRHVDSDVADSWVSATFEPVGRQEGGGKGAAAEGGGKGAAAKGGKPVTLKRTLGSPGDLEITGKAFPSLDDLLETASLSGAHLLTRREILRYILATPGTRADQVNAVLGITEVDSWRKAIEGAQRDAKKKAGEAAAVAQQLEANLLASVDPPADDRDALLRRVNDLRSALGAKNVASLEPGGALDAGVTKPSGAVANPLASPDVAKAVHDLSAWFETGVSGLLDQAETYLAAVSELREDPEMAEAAQIRDLLGRGLDLLGGRSAACPLCKREWDPDDLRQLLEKRLAGVEEVRARLDDVKARREAGLAPMFQVIGNLQTLAAAAADRDDEATATLTGYLAGLGDVLESLFPEPFGDVADDAAKTLRDAGAALHDETTKDTVARLLLAADEPAGPDLLATAWDHLQAAARGWGILSDAEAAAREAQEVAERAATAAKLFVKARDDILGDVWSRVSNRFSELYCTVHHEDESTFEAVLESKRAGLDLKVDFYGHGKHPPHALHSEGHQDSMGIFLFLALAEMLTNGRLSFVILDDVLMSVDRGHRRAVARMLRENFPHSQFLITTHDEVWWRQLRTEGVVARPNDIQFHGWSIDEGPQFAAAARDLLSLARSCLEAGNIPGSAHALRRACEAYLPELCDNLGAPVRFRGNGEWTSGDMLNGVKKRFSDLIGYARKSATSWGKDSTDLDGFDARRKEVYTALDGESWAINAAVHHNAWADLGPEDFHQVIDIYERFFGLFICKTCGGFLRLVEEEARKVRKERRSPAQTAVRCPCGGVMWNLEKKKG